MPSLALESALDLIAPLTGVGVDAGTLETAIAPGQAPEVTPPEVESVTFTGRR